MIAVALLAGDALTREEVAGLLDGAPDIVMNGVAEDETALFRLIEEARLDVVVVAPNAGDAPDFIRQIAEDAPVVALVADDRAAMRALRSGARGALIRPADRAALAAAIRAVAAGLSVHPPDLFEDAARPSEADGATFGAPPSQVGLTPREMEVLTLLAAGASNKLIARRLGISVHTTKFHVAGIFDKLGAASRIEAVALAARLGLVLL